MTIKHAGPTALLRKATQLQVHSGNVFWITTALIKYQLQLLWKILNNALKRNALINGLLAKKIPSANLLSMIVWRSVELRLPAGLYVFHQREVKLLLMSQNVLKPMIVSRRLKLLSSWILLRNASRNTVRQKNKTVSTTEDALQLSNTAITSVSMILTVGEDAWRKLRILMQTDMSSALLIMIACTKSQLLLLWKILNNALNRSVLRNGLLARKIPSANLLLMTAWRNVDQKNPAGLFVSQQKEVKLLLTLQNAVKLITA